MKMSHNLPAISDVTGAARQPTRCAVERGLDKITLYKKPIKLVQRLKTKKPPLNEEMMRNKLGHVTYFLHRPNYWCEGK